MTHISMTSSLNSAWRRPQQDVQFNMNMAGSAPSSAPRPTQPPVTRSMLTPSPAASRNTGLPVDFAHQRHVTTTQVAGSMVARNDFNARDIPAPVVGDALNLPRHMANSVTRLASGDPSPTPSASARELEALLAEKSGPVNTPRGMQRDVRELADIGNVNQRFDFWREGMTFSGFRTALDDVGMSHLATRENYSLFANSDPVVFRPDVITVRDMRFNGVDVQPNGDFRLSEFAQAVAWNSAQPVRHCWEPAKPAGCWTQQVCWTPSPKSWRGAH